MKVYRYNSKVDVVPVINVSLVVVLTLMMISPFLSETPHDVALPEARAHQMDDTDKTEITYTLDGKIYIGEEEVTLDQVRETLLPLFEENPDAVAVVKADRNLLYGDVERLIAQVEAAKAPRIAIATDKKAAAGEGAP